MIRAAIVGASHWHVPLYVPGWLETHEIVAISDPDGPFVAGLVRTFDAPWFAEWRRMLDEIGDVDVVYVFSPNDQMHDVAAAVIEQGIPLVVEKPAGASVTQLDDLIARSQAAATPVAVPLVQRLGPLPELLGRVGRVTHLSFSFIAGPPERYLANGSPWMLDPARVTGGAQLNLGLHFVDLFAELGGGRPEVIGATASNTLHGYGVEDHSVMLLRSSSGATGTVEVGYAFPAAPQKRQVSFAAIGDAGYCAIDTDGDWTFVAADSTTMTGNVRIDVDKYYAEFARRIADGAFAELPGLADLRRSVALTMDAYEIARA